jgi:hypothetical protein
MTFHFFRTPSAEELARRQLAETERNLLRTHEEIETAAAHLALYTARANRLRSYLAKQPQPDTARKPLRLAETSGA